MKQLAIFSTGDNRCSSSSLFTLALDWAQKSIKMKQSVRIFALIAFFVIGMSPLSAQRTLLLIMNQVKYDCVTVNGKFTPTLSVTLDNGSFSTFGTTIEYVITGGVYTTSVPLILNVATPNSNMSLNPHTFPMPTLIVGTTYTINSKTTTGVGGYNTLTFVPTTSLCSPVPIDTIPAKDIGKCPTPLNLISNGNFMYGNDGSFQSGLAFSCNSCTAGSYCIGNQLSSKCNAWAANTFDHTLGNASGSYMIVDGNATKPSTVWSDTVCVCNGVDYTFSFWVKSVYPASQQIFDLGLIIDGVNQKTVNITQTNPAWTKYEVTWTSNKKGCIPIAIQQLTGGAFRDFGLDDIAFEYCCDCNAATNIEDECVVNIDTTIINVSCGNIVDIKSIFEGTPTAIKYTIYDATGAIIFTTSNTSQFTFMLPSTGAFYGLVEISCGGDEDQDVFEILNLAPVADFRLNSSFSCINGSPSRTIKTLDYSNEAGTLSYAYLVTDIVAQTSNLYTTAEPTFTLNSKKAYNVELTVTDPKGCTAKKSLKVSEVTTCEAKFNWWYAWCEDGCVGPKNITVNFENNSEYSNCSVPPVYTWSYGDGQTATGNNLQHTYNAVPCNGKSFNVILTMTFGNPGDADYCQSVSTNMITIDNIVPKAVVSRICCDGLVFFTTDAVKGNWSTPGSMNIPSFPIVSKQIWSPLGIQVGQNYRQYYQNAGTYYVMITNMESINHNRCPPKEVKFVIPKVDCLNRNVREKQVTIVEGILVTYKFTALALPGVHQMKAKIWTSKKVSEISSKFSGMINGESGGCFCNPFAIGNPTGTGVRTNKRKAKYLESTSGKYRIGMNQATAYFYIKTKAGNPYAWQLSLGKHPCDHPWFLFF